MGDTLDYVGLVVRDVMEGDCIPVVEDMDCNSSLYLLVTQERGGEVKEGRGCIL